MSRADEIIEHLGVIAETLPDGESVVEQLRRIANALEGKNKASRSWAAIYGSARKHIRPEALGRQFEDTLIAHGFCRSFLEKDFGTSPEVFPIISVYTPDELEESFAVHTGTYEEFMSKRDGYCESIAMNVVFALQAAGLWEH